MSRTYPSIDKPEALSWPVYWYYLRVTTCITVLQSKPHGNRHEVLDPLINRLPRDLST